MKEESPAVAYMYTKRLSHWPVLDSHFPRSFPSVVEMGKRL